jgi:hypothetical protein
MMYVGFEAFTVTECSEVFSFDQPYQYGIISIETFSKMEINSVLTWLITKVCFIMCKNSPILWENIKIQGHKW